MVQTALSVLADEHLDAQRQLLGREIFMTRVLFGVIRRAYVTTHYSPVLYSRPFHTIRRAMADNVQPPTQQMQELSTSGAGPANGNPPQPNQILDEETGDYVSKTELKKRVKQREKDKQKAEREANRQAPPAAKRKANAVAEDESNLNANVGVPRSVE